MKKLIMIFLGLFLVAILTSCATKTGCRELNGVTSEQVNQCIIDGKTTKEDILGFFGHDFNIKLDSKDRETWVYSFEIMSHMPRNFIPYNLISQGYNIKHKRLIIMYNENDVVQKHCFHAYGDETKFGAFD